MLHNYDSHHKTLCHCGNRDRNTELLHVNYFILYDYYNAKLELKFFFYITQNRFSFFFSSEGMQIIMHICATHMITFFRRRSECARGKDVITYVFLECFRICFLASFVSSCIYRQFSSWKELIDLYNLY